MAGWAGSQARPYSSSHDTGGDPCRAAVMNQGLHLGLLHDASCRSPADPCSWKGLSKSSRRTAPLPARTGLSSLCAPADGASSSLGATRAIADGRSGRPHRRPRSGTRSEDSSSRRAPSDCRSATQPPDDWKTGSRAGDTAPSQSHRWRHPVVTLFCLERGSLDGWEAILGNSVWAEWPGADALPYQLVGVPGRREAGTLGCAWGVAAPER